MMAIFTVKPFLVVSAMLVTSGMSVVSRDPISALVTQFEKFVGLEKNDATTNETVPPLESSKKALRGQRTYRFRLCNAYTGASPLEMSLTQPSKRGGSTIGEPLEYKACRDFPALPIVNGSQLSFRVGTLDVGVFSLHNLPEADALLMLAPHRKSEQGAAMSFFSHMYVPAAGKAVGAQMAAFDAYRGTASSKLFIQDEIQNLEEKGKDQKIVALKLSEPREIQFSSTALMPPGLIHLSLLGPANKVAASIELSPRLQDSYTVLRVGGGQQSDKNPWPEELVVFPHAAPENLKSGTVRVSISTVTFFGTLSLIWLRVFSHSL